MDAWLAFRFAKFVGVAVFSAGVLGSLFARDIRDRRLAAHGAATLGLVAVWVAGYGLVKARGLSIGEPWISRSLLAGLGAMFAAAWAANESVVPRAARALGVGALLSAFGMMSTRQADVWLAVVLPVVGAAVAWAAPPGRGSAEEGSADGPTATFAWFAWLARAEGLSLLLLFGVYMPLKYGAGIVLDGGQGWFGWLHGVLQLLYLVALVAAARALGWSSWTMGLGFAASLLPFGTFVFEAKARPS
ncbi:MAG: DUF3817 domain-containing protein [Myxococcota bacterium]